MVPLRSFVTEVGECLLLLAVHVLAPLQLITPYQHCSEVQRGVLCTAAPTTATTTGGVETLIWLATAFGGGHGHTLKPGEFERHSGSYSPHVHAAGRPGR